MPLVIPLLILAFFLTRVAAPRFSQLLEAGGAVRKNYAGKQIPVAAGISILAAAAVCYFFVAIIDLNSRLEILTTLAVVLAMGLLGFVDDLLGTRDVTGIKGHLSMLIRGKLTTGGLKALGGGGLAFGFSLLISNNPVEIIVNTLVIALFTNAINLMDLRPGRACKAFLFAGLLFLVDGLLESDRGILLLAPVYGSVLAFLPYDLKGQVMMGDTGSNTLGITLGIVAVVMLSLLWKVILLALLLLLHVYTEKYSLTETIKKIGVLRAIDEWGTLK